MSTKYRNLTPIFKRLGWNEEISSSGRYRLWTNSENLNQWMVLPLDENASDFEHYLEKVIKLIVYAHQLEYTPTNIDDVRNQLQSFDYKLLCRFKSTSEFEEDTIPFELAQQLPSKEVSSLRHFVTMKYGTRRSIPIENFSLNHTQKGSFIIPVSIEAHLDENVLLPIESQTLGVLKQYLGAVGKLVSLQISDPQQYANDIVENKIDSRMVRDFYTGKDSIAGLKEKYSWRVQELSMYGKYNPILDTQHLGNDRIIKKINLGNIRPLPYEFIDSVEKLEESLDERSFSYLGVDIEVLADHIGRDGKARFTVLSINGIPIEKQPKARSQELTRDYINLCANSIISGESLIIKGDITKSRRKVGKITVGNVSPTPVPPLLSI